MERYELEHIEVLRKLAPECMVLLKSDGTFPLAAPEKVALYGNGARRTIKGGTGSGDVNVRSFTTVEQGLENAGFTVTTKPWLDGYDAAWEKAHSDFNESIKAKIAAEGMGAVLSSMGAVMAEPIYDLPIDGEGELAIYVLGRISGEGTDRTLAAGDFHLTNTEIRDILTAAKRYPKFLLVLNVGGVVDLTPVVDAVNNILLLSQPGMTVGDSFADVLLGKSYPSGKLASTWAAWEDYCHEGNFGAQDDTYYKEGIYVGYRYFDSAGKAPLFPFGFGLAYTDFVWKAEKTELDGTAVTVTARVTNVGKRAGKEVLQLYVSLPQGKLDQPYQVLAAFAKTAELQAGESQTLSLSFDLRGIAPFDPETASTVLEAGDYVLRLGNSSRNTDVCGVVRLDKDTIVQKLSAAGGDCGFTDWKPEKPVKVTVPANVPVLPLYAEDVHTIEVEEPQIDPKAAALAKTLTDSELAYLCVGGFVGEGSKNVIGNAAQKVAGAAGETTAMLLDKGVPSLIMADGPAGLRLSRLYGVDENGVYSIEQGGDIAFMMEILPAPVLAALGLSSNKDRHGEIREQNCSAIPVGTALAQSWNPALCETCGDLVGEEMDLFGINIWLAPALNIHRLPLCGRNFEYYSEDPLISGKMAAAIVRGVQRHPGRTVAVKHFCCNNQETNRFRSCSNVSLRALREIYLKGFEIAIRESDPATVMSSYNLLNGEHTSQREDLMETVLRKEWGYKGIVMSDWVAAGFPSLPKKYPGAVAHGSIKAGNDIMMPGGPLDHQNLLAALNGETEKYHLTRERLETCAARMIALAWRLKEA